MKMRKNNDNIDEEEKEELKIKNVTDKVIIVENGKTKKEKKKKEKAPKIKDNFVPPDGGWGWIIVIAAGFSNVSFVCRIKKYFKAAIRKKKMENSILTFAIFIDTIFR